MNSIEIWSTPYDQHAMSFLSRHVANKTSAVEYFEKKLLILLFSSMSLWIFSPKNQINECWTHFMAQSTLMWMLVGDKSRIVCVRHWSWLTARIRWAFQARIDAAHSSKSYITRSTRSFEVWDWMAFLILKSVFSKVTHSIHILLCSCWQSSSKWRDLFSLNANPTQWSPTWVERATCIL